MTISIEYHKYLTIGVFADTTHPKVAELLATITENHYELRYSNNCGSDLVKDAAIGTYIISVDENNIEASTKLVTAIRKSGNRSPIWAVADSHPIAEVGYEGLGEIEGYIYLNEQSPAYYTKQIISSLQYYADTLLPPFFGALMSYDADANIAFDCPGHQGGQFFKKSPAGSLFFKHFGETLFRNDLCNADVDLGDLLIHEGAACRAQQYAAEVFGADKTYFVLNGTSSSNKVVNNAALKKGDLVLFDRNNHKSNHHGALIQAGAIPIYLPAARNAHGMVGAIDWAAFDEDYLREQIKNNPQITDPEAYNKERPFRLAIIELATYDGTVYNAKKVMEKIGHLCEYVLWDEAWIGYNAFHPLFKDHSPMRLENLGPDMPGLFSTQSVHKQLAGFSQASQIHKRDAHIKGQKRYINHKRFNESFLLHASTSPFYPIFASLDVNAKIHEGKSGEMLWDSCIELGIESRKKIRELGKHYKETGKTEREQWFFDPFVPDVVSVKNSAHTADLTNVAWEDIPTEVLKQEQQCWTFDPSAKWHGYEGYADGYAMVDPNKLMLLTAGINRETGEYLDFGVPATVVANFLRENGVIPEKCDLNSILFLMTPAEDESKLNTLIAKLAKFKELYDRNAPLSEVLPSLYAAHRERYKNYTIQQICNEMHNFYRDMNIKNLQRLTFRDTSFPEQAISAQDANNALVGNNVDYVAMDEIKGRIAATLALIYPPGIGIVVPGERWDDNSQPMLDYFLAFEESFNRFEGFNYEVQGVYQEKVDGRIKFFTYAVQE